MEREDGRGGEEERETGRYGEREWEGEDEEKEANEEGQED